MKVMWSNHIFKQPFFSNYCRKHQCFNKYWNIKKFHLKTVPLRQSYVKSQHVRFCSSEQFDSRDKPFVVFDKLQSRLQEDIIKDVLNYKDVPNNEKWEQIRNHILSIKGGKINERNIDGSLLFNLRPNLPLTKSFIQYINKKNKKLSLLQLANLFYSYYLNKNVCSAEDKLFIKKMYNQICNNKNNDVHFDSATVTGLVSGISVTDSWKDGLILLDKLQEPTLRHYTPLIEAAIENDDIPFATKYLKKYLMHSNKDALPENISELWIRKINTKQKLDDFLYFLHDMGLLITNSLANMIEDQCRQHNIYRCTHTSIANTGECRECYYRLNACKISSNEFEELKNAFLKKAIVGQDLFRKTTPEEYDSFLKFLKETAPYDIVMDGLNVAHYEGPRSKAETLQLVIDHYLKQNKRILLLGREHMSNWPSRIMNYIKRNCQFFLVNNLSQDDPYMLYATMYSGVNTKFISRDLMRQHLFLLPNENMKELFRKWQQLNQIVILGIFNKKLKIRYTNEYHVIVQPGNVKNGGDPLFWHVPYRLENIEKTFQNVFKPESTWLCLQSENTLKKSR